MAKTAMGMISGSVAPLLMARIKLTRLLFVSQLGQFVVFSLLVLYLWNRGDSSVLLQLLGIAWIAETFGIVPLFVFAACLTSVTVVIGLLSYKVFHRAEETGQESASTL